MIQLFQGMAALAMALPILAAGVAVSYSQNADPQTQQVVGAVVRFSAGSTSVDVVIGEDNPTVRDFLSLLPLTMELDEYAGHEKIGYFSRKLTTTGSPGSDPEDGDLIYFSTWGNIGFYYNASGIDYSSQTIHMGKYNATMEQLEKLTQQLVQVKRIQ
ncbi:hypothetical protein HDIA_P0066 (plasmid) [Hartmannibacter diazotrophicus]|uniref:Cyclophilin-like domain-containing protein n=1 Tax=Hartmannibacter diazotrophicus TaxID=1482074 RepID=A0A2C9DEG5_9HYPH|nr:cyclophilin-like fold protein [Hartmannibacter diazotrophicus]SON58475.1 hypothetical protein HDIA_P0066 [Hartmannibacter diazotrophicus]